MWKFLANLFLFALAIGLTIFTASRTLDLLQHWIPDNQQLYRYLALAAFEGGLYFWSFFLAVQAKGAAQRGIALLMAVVSFVGVAIATISDLLLTGAQNGTLPPLSQDQQQSVVVFVGVVVVLNVAAFLAAKLTSPDKLKEWAMQDAEDLIEDTNLKMISRAAPHVAAQAAPLMTERWVSETWQRMLPYSARPMIPIEGSMSYQQMGEIAAPARESRKEPQAATQVAEEKPGLLDRARAKLREAVGQLGGPKQRDEGDDGAAPAPVAQGPAPTPAPVAAAVAVPDLGQAAAQPVGQAPRPFMQAPKQQYESPWLRAQREQVANRRRLRRERFTRQRGGSAGGSSGGSTGGSSGGSTGGGGQ